MRTHMRVRTRMSKDACACPMHAYAYTGLCTHDRVPETRKSPFFNYIKL